MSSRAHSSTTSSSSLSSSNAKVHNRTKLGPWPPKYWQVPRDKSWRVNLLAYTLGASRDVRRVRANQVLDAESDPLKLVVDEARPKCWVRNKKRRSPNSPGQPQKASPTYPPATDAHYVPPAPGHFGSQHYGDGAQTGVVPDRTRQHGDVPDGHARGTALQDMHLSNEAEGAYRRGVGAQ